MVGAMPTALRGHGLNPTGMPTQSRGHGTRSLPTILERKVYYRRCSSHSSPLTVAFSEETEKGIEMVAIGTDFDGFSLRSLRELDECIPFRCPLSKCFSRFAVSAIH